MKVRIPEDHDPDEVLEIDPVEEMVKQMMTQRVMAVPMQAFMEYVIVSILPKKDPAFYKGAERALKKMTRGQPLVGEDASLKFTPPTFIPTTRRGFKVYLGVRYKGNQTVVDVSYAETVDFLKTGTDEFHSKKFKPLTGLPQVEGDRIMFPI